MAYEVTAIRKRPHSFDHLAGQDFVVTTLKSSLRSGRIAHAYLFAGPRGVGKTSAARILARCLNCVNGPTDQPCGECENCKEIVQGNSLDVIEIDGASNTSVNDVREIKDEVLFSPSTSRYKVYIIDEVHMLSNSAFNALLKTIEEPPPYIIFIFATTEVHKVPATIRSRCQQFNFRLISVETIQKLLAEVAAETGVESDDEALFWIAKEATGSLRDAFTLFDQIVSFSEKRITLELIRQKLGLVGMEQVNSIVEQLVERNVSTAINEMDEVLQRGVSIEQFVVDLAEYFRSLLFIKHGVTRESLLGHNVDRFSSVVLGKLSGEQIEQAVELVLKLYRDIRYSLNQRYELELVLSRIAALPDFIHPAAIARKIRALREEIGGVRPDAGSGFRQEGDRREHSTGTSGAAHVTGAAADVEINATSSASAGAPAVEPRARGRTSGGTRSEPERTKAVGKTPQGGGGSEGMQTGSAAVGDGADSSYADQEWSTYEDQPASSPDGEDVSSPPGPSDASPAQGAGTAEGVMSTSQRKALIDSLKNAHPSLASSLLKVESWTIADESLTLVCPTQYHLAKIADQKTVLLDALKEVLGRSYRVELSSEAGAQGSSRKQEQSAESAKATGADERIERIRRVFRGEIVDGG